MLADIYLQQFRSYTDESFELDPAVNIIVGPNASGKTNLLEAILLIARGSSYRSISDQELIQFNKPWAKLVARTTKNEEREMRLDLSSAQIQKQFKIDGKPYKRLSLGHTIPVVVFEPNHLLIVSGAPDLRRHYMDDLIEQIKPGYSTLRRQYARTLSQRNSLLKKGSALSNDQLFAWDVRLSELGQQIATERSKLVDVMNNSSANLYNQLSKSQDQLTLKYLSTASLERYGSSLLQKLEAHHSMDFERGFTSCGPHREDLGISLNGHLLQESASRGERRTLMLVLKIIEAQIIEESRQTRPLLLLDDVFSELDGARRQALTSFLQPYQTFITTTDADVVVQHFTESARIIPIRFSTQENQTV